MIGKKWILAVIVLLLISGGVVLGINYIKNVFNALVNETVLHALLDIPLTREVEREVTTPEPLRTERDAPEPYLTRTGSIQWTNSMRQQNGVGPLTENELLNQSAQKKLDDMFTHQYFEHNSPQGIRPADVVASVGYDYIMTGENLALGNFADDQDLIQAWMDSPGHRENMLKAGYTEIGIAVGQGIYEGKQTWMAVQHFGKPTSVCPVVDKSIKDTLDKKSEQVKAIENELDQIKKELDGYDELRSQEDADKYNSLVDKYNAKVKDYNVLIEEMKSLSNTYNNQVNAYNTCAKN